MSVWALIGLILLIAVGSVLLIALILLMSSLTLRLEYDNGLSFKVKLLFFTLMMDPESPKQIRKQKKKERKKKKKEEKKRLKEKRKADKLRKKHKKAAHLNSAADIRRARSEKKSGTDNMAGAAASGSNRNGGAVNQQGQNKDGQRQAAAKTASKANAKEDKKAKLDLKLIIRIFDKAKPHIKRLFKKIRITDVLIDIMVGGDDAAKTAVSYGVHCAAIQGFMGFLEKTVTVKTDRVVIKADFDLEKTDYYARAKVKLRVCTFLRCVVWGFFAVKREIDGDSDPKQTQAHKKPPKKAA